MMMDQPNFLQSVFQNISAIPGRLWALGVTAGACLSAYPLLKWYGIVSPHPLVWLFIGTGILLWAAALYLGAMTILARPVSLSAGLRFVVSELVLIAPATIASVGLLWVKGTPALFLLIALVVLALVLLWLPAWPVANSLSHTIAAPLEIFRATKGHRWGLIMAAVLGAAPSRLTADLPPASDSGLASFYWLVDAALTTFSLVVATSTTATAWQYAVRNDPALEPDAP